MITRKRKIVSVSLTLAFLLVGCAEQGHIYPESKPKDSMIQEIGGDFYVENYYRDEPIGNTENHRIFYDEYEDEKSNNKDGISEEKLMTYGELEDKYVIEGNIAYLKSENQKEYVQNAAEKENDMSWYDESKNISGPKVVRRNSSRKIERIPFPQREYNQIPLKGNGSVEGGVFFESAAGGKIPVSGARMYLNPVTSYSKQWYEETYLNGKTMEKADDRIYNYIKYTTSTKNGKYAFYGLPEGRYYLTGIARCGDQCGFSEKRTLKFFSEVYIGRHSEVQEDIFAHMN